MASTIRDRQERTIKLFKISHVRSLLMIGLILTTCYLIFKPMHPTVGTPTYKIKSIHLLATPN
jgi:hypothetical protein